MIADGHLVGDGSWELRVLVTDLSVERCLRVKGDLHIGGVMLRLVEELGIPPLQQQQFVHGAREPIGPWHGLAREIRSARGSRRAFHG